MTLLRAPRACKGFVVLRPEDEPPLSNSLHIPEVARIRSDRGRVVSVGVDSDNWLAEGDLVVFRGAVVEIGDHIIVESKHVMARLAAEAES